MSKEEERSDEALAVAGRDGDREAFAELVERHRNGLVRAAGRRLPARIRGRVSSSDVVQECLATAHGRLGDFEDRGPGSFGRWLKGILENKIGDKIRDHLKRGRRDANREVALGSRPDARGLTQDAPSPGTRLVDRETRDAVARALASRPADQQTVLRLIHDGGLSMAQAAEQMGRTPEATRKLYARSVASLASALGELRSRVP